MNWFLLGIGNAINSYTFRTRDFGAWKITKLVSSLSPLKDTFPCVVVTQNKTSKMNKLLIIQVVLCCAVVMSLMNVAWCNLDCYRPAAYAYPYAYGGYGACAPYAYAAPVSYAYPYAYGGYGACAPYAYAAPVSYAYPYAYGGIC